MLKATDLKITFNPGTPIETRALQGLSLEIPTGQFVTVIGTNGAGKSTFLNAVSGDQQFIDDTVRCKNSLNDTCRYYPGKKVRHIADRLHHPFEG